VGILLQSESVSGADANVQQNSQNNVGADTENLGQCWCEDYYGDGCSCSFHEGGWGGGGPGYGFDGPGYGWGGPGDGGWGGGYHETLVDGKKMTQEVPDQRAKDLISQQESDLAGMFAAYFLWGSVALWAHNSSTQSSD